MPLTHQPFAETPQLDEIRRRLSLNVSFPERLASVLSGVGLLALASRQRSGGAFLLGAAAVALLHRGTTGHCPAYRALGINSEQLQTERGVPGNRGTKVEETIVIQRPRPELFAFWRNLENLPRFMKHVKFVEVLDAKRSRWTVDGPAGRTVAWTAEIINEHENELIAWESLPGAQVRNAGSVRFEDAPGGGTSVKVNLEFDPPAGAIGAIMSRLLGESPEKQLREDLSSLKEIVESGGRPV
ncbi:MAG: putative integral rane protein [Chthoniobacteraceae bacterium]|nr:putative integral rane protein [Chthoniobacteraceae bacterium]